MKLMLTLIAVIAWIAMTGTHVMPDADEHPPQSEAGKNLYLKYCSTCHGADGKGDGLASLYLFPKPRDLTAGVFKFQSTPSGELPTDDDLRRTITSGMPGSAMPSWDRLTEQEITDVVAYVKSFSNRFASATPSGVVAIENEPQRTSKTTEEGKSVYALMGCWTCHGKTGAGDGPSSSSLKDDNERSIRPYNFTRAGAFKGGGRPRDIFRTFSTGIGGTPMPGYGEDALALTKESYADLGNLEGQYTLSEISEIRNFVQLMPSDKELNAKSAEERQLLADKRRWSLVHYVLSLSAANKQPISYTTKDHPLNAAVVENSKTFADPASVDWQGVPTLELPLISLWQRETPTDRIAVQSVTDGQAVVFRLDWEDATKDDGALHQSAFGDAAAIQFPLDPASEPFFAMGDTTFVVNIWQWKSVWQRDMDAYLGVRSAFPNIDADFYLFDVGGGSRAEYFVSGDSAKKISMPWNAGWSSGNLNSAQHRASSVEDLNAKGFGTLTSQGPGGQNVQGNAAWQNGKWTVVFVRSLESTEKNDVILKPGVVIPVAFAVWDGSLNDRNGQKMVTNWYRLTIGTRKEGGK